MLWQVSTATDTFSFGLEQTLWSRMLVGGECLLNILISTSVKTIFAPFFAAYLTNSIIAFLGKADVSTSFDRISNNRIPGLPGKSKQAPFAGAMEGRKIQHTFWKKYLLKKKGSKLMVFF